MIPPEHKTGPKSPTDFSDQRIHDVVHLGFPLTSEEREFLVTYTAPFEECQPETEGDLRALSDGDLMRRCYDVWADYASTQV